MSAKDSDPSAAWVSPTLWLSALGGALAPWVHLEEEDDAMIFVQLHERAAKAAEFTFEPLLNE